MPNLDDIYQIDPASAALYAKIFGNKGNGMVGPNSFGNQQIVDKQDTPPPPNQNLDQATLQQPQLPPMPSGSIASAAGANAVANRGAKTKSEQMVYDTANQLDNNPAFEAQKNALSNYQQQVKDYISKKPGFQNLNLSPLLALADAWNPGSHMAASYNAPESADEHELRAAQMGSNLEQRSADVAKTQQDLIRDKLNAFVGVDKANKEIGPNQSLLIDKMDNMDHLRNISGLKRDPELINMHRNTLGINNALDSFDSANVKTTEQFNDLQNSVRTNLGLSNRSGVEERAGTYFKNSAMDMARAKQYLFNKAEDIGEDIPDLVEHLKNVVQLIQRNNLNAVQDMVVQKTGGLDSMYARPENAGRFQDLQKLRQDTVNLFKPHQKDAAPIPNQSNAFQPVPQPQASGGQDPQVADFAKNYTGGDYAKAEKFLIEKRGYRRGGQ